MKVNQHMDLYALAEHMGKDATPEEAERMRDQLVRGCWPDTESVPDELWGRMLAEVVK